MGVLLELYVAEDWIQPLAFYTDPVAADPAQQTFDSPMALTDPHMMVKGADTTQVLATLNNSGTADGTLALGGTGQLTIHLPHAKTLTLQGAGQARFDIFAVVDGARRCILKSGTILVTDSVTDWPDD